MNLLKILNSLPDKKSLCLIISFKAKLDLIGIEMKFWKYLMDENLLFDSNEKNRAYLLNNGPYTIGLPEESPDRMGQFLGYKMVLNYLQNNDIKLKKLLDIDYKTILKSFNP